MTTDIAVERWLPEPGGAPARWHVTLRCGADRPPEAVPAPDMAGQGGLRGAGRIALPAPVNAHDHGYGIRTLDFGANDDALEPWITGLGLRPRTDPWLEALVAFGRVASSGCGTTIHCHNSLNADRLAEEAAEVVRAAAVCGIRLGLSCPLLDASPFVYGGLAALARTASPDDLAWAQSRTPHFAPVAEQIAAVVEIARRHAGPGVSVQLGPIGPQWASDALLEAVAEASAAHDLRIHMHLLESPRQRRWLDQRFPDGIVPHLDRIGFLSPRLAVAHGVHLTPAECALLAERGVVLVSNPSANLRLRSGVAPLAAIRNAGLAVAIGLDGTGFNDAQDIWHEMRLFDLLHRGSGLVPAHGAADVFTAVTETGGRVAGVPAGGGDIVVLDGAELMRDAIVPDADPTAHILARGHAGMVRELVVRGRHVVRDGALCGFDLDAARTELVAQARADAPRLQSRHADALRLARIVRAHYQAIGS